MDDAAEGARDFNLLAAKAELDGYMAKLMAMPPRIIRAEIHDSHRFAERCACRRCKPWGIYRRAA